MKHTEFFLPGIDAKARSVGSISYWTLGLGGEVAVGLSFGGEDGTTVVSSFWGDSISGIKTSARSVKFQKQLLVLNCYHEVSRNVSIQCLLFTDMHI